MNLKTTLPVIVHAKGKVTSIPKGQPLPKEAVSESQLKTLKGMGAVAEPADVPAATDGDDTTTRKADKPKG